MKLIVNSIYGLTDFFPDIFRIFKFLRGWGEEKGRNRGVAINQSLVVFFDSNCNVKYYVICTQHKCQTPLQLSVLPVALRLCCAHLRKSLVQEKRRWFQNCLWIRNSTKFHLVKFFKDSLVESTCMNMAWKHLLRILD